MDARVKTVREILHSDDQFHVPFFQRHYSWRKDNWQRLLDDIVILTEEADDTKHFLGPLVCTPFHPMPGEVTPYQLIDGQQRLTTLTLALAALRDIAKLKSCPDLVDEIHEDYLIHHRRHGIQRFKVVPRLGDRTPYEEVIEGTAAGTTASAGILSAYSFFKREWKRLANDEVEASLRRLLIAATARLSLVAITVDAENPYEIFESLNSTGLPLEEADLIRNFLFMQVALDEQNDFHTRHWEPFETMFEASGDYERLSPTLFYRSYLMRDGAYCKNKAAYVAFRKHNRDRAILPTMQVGELKRFAKFELWLRRPLSCDNNELCDAFAEIQALDITTAHPLLMNLLDRHDQDRLSKEELLGCFSDLSSFVLRRSVCGESTRAYGRWFSDAVKSIKFHPRQDLGAYWLEKGWPDDTAFIPHLVEFAIYKRERNKLRILLEALERQSGHKEELKLQLLSIEHVMPQALGNDEDGTAWRKILGSEWKTLHEKWLHTLGNLTLTGYNPELGNSSFTKKQKALAESNVSLNEHFLTVSAWSERSIRERGQLLAGRVARLWPRPIGGPTYFPPSPAHADQGDIVDSEELIEEEVRPRGRGRLRVRVRWAMLDKALSDEEFCENRSGATMAEFLGKLIRIFGDQLADQLTRIPVSRKHALSSNPGVDFLNASTGRPYGHALVPGTGLYVFTNTSNSEKVQDIRKLVSILGFSADSVDVAIVD